MSFRNPASSHLNDNVWCCGDQMFGKQKEERHLTKWHLCNGNYSTAIIWSAIVGLKSHREPNTHKADGHQPIKQNMLIRALQKLSHFRGKKDPLLSLILAPSLLTQNSSQVIFRHDALLNGTIILATGQEIEWGGSLIYYILFAPELGVWVTSSRVCKNRFAWIVQWLCPSQSFSYQRRLFFCQ